ncbi:MAG: GNAT family N-acetyltransferase [Spirochaetaceae bacterium]|nr:GNAT family N-acetyltransferase [Spirochaetaceae bacterium]
MEIRLATEGDREAISRIFVEAYYKDLNFFSKNQVKLTKAFKHTFVVESFYVALIDDEVAAITACLPVDKFCISRKTGTLIKYLGLIKGLIAGYTLKHYFNKTPKYPLVKNMANDTLSIEFVAANSKFKRQGAVTALFNYLLNLPNGTFVLEVADTNTAAFTLYSKLGFKEVARKKMSKLASKYSGVNNLLYMQYNKS